MHECPGAVEENNGIAPLLSGRSNVRHIKGILPVVYKPQKMAASTKAASEIMFATGNANKLREVLTFLTLSPHTPMHKVSNIASSSRCPVLTLHFVAC